MRYLIELKETVKCLKADNEKYSLNQIKKEKAQLMNSIQNIANELDKQSEKYKKIKETLSQPDYTSYLRMISEYIRLKEDNKLLNQISQLDADKKKLLFTKYDIKENNNNSIIKYDNRNKNIDNERKEKYYFNVDDNNLDHGILLNKYDTFSFAFGLLSCV